MEPQIRYARREDGARTAYAMMGHGPVLVVPPGFLSHLDWTLQDEPRRFWDALAEHRTLVLYDRHGVGMSDRNRTDFSAEDDMRDLEAVVAASGADQIELFGISFGGSPALRFAGEHPERVRRLILWGTVAGIVDPDRFPPEIRAKLEATRALRHSDPDSFMRLSAAQLFPSGIDPETFNRFVSVNRAAATLDMQEKLDAVQFHQLNGALVPLVTSPTLIVHRRGDQMVPFMAGEYLARHLPNASLAPLEGDQHLPFYGDVDAALDVLLKFLGTGSPAPEAAVDNAPAPSGTAIILFADIADSTALTERIGDAVFRDRARNLDDALRIAIRDNGGAAIDGFLSGDGVLATFPAASQAIAAALACAAAGDDQSLPLHLGLHAGDVIREQNNVFGGAVNIASRISALAAPGEVLVSRTVADLARTSAVVTFDDRGEHALKGVSDPQRVFAVRKDVP